jgi:hypothetical protein
LDNERRIISILVSCGGEADLRRPAIGTGKELTCTYILYIIEFSAADVGTHFVKNRFYRR